MTKTKFPPTAEQEEALRLFLTRQSMKIEAGAGTGKTSTLQLLAESDGRSMQYVAFNRAIVEESKSKFPRNVKCNTAHSLAYGSHGHQYANRHKNRMWPSEVAAILGIGEGRMVETFTGDKRYLSASKLASITMGTVNRWCQSADRRPTRMHVEAIRGLDDPFARGSWASTHQRSIALAAELEPYMLRAWDDLCLYDGALRFEPAHYLKMWQLDPATRINRDVILFDEAQDASPVMVDVIQRQTHAQIVWVGDSQQQIYEFTGAINALATVPAEHTAYLTQSFRFGPQVADVANGLLTGLRSPLRLKGFEPIESTVGPLAEPKAILTRTNATGVRRLLEAHAAGRKAHLMGGGDDVLSFARAAERLQAGERVEHPELFMFETWPQLLEYVAEHGDEARDLQLLVDLVTEFTVAAMIEALGAMPTEQAADLVISTAHKSKGRQWTTVQLAEDFGENPDDGEMRLMYVACTRAQHGLDITATPQIERLVDSQEPAEAAQEPAGAPANGGQHAQPATPSDPQVEAHRAAGPWTIILGGSVNGISRESHDEAAALQAAKAFHMATGEGSRVLNTHGTIVAEHGA